MVFAYATALLRSAFRRVYSDIFMLTKMLGTRLLSRTSWFMLLTVAYRLVLLCISTFMSGVVRAILKYFIKKFYPMVITALLRAFVA